MNEPFWFTKPQVYDITKDKRYSKCRNCGQEVYWNWEDIVQHYLKNHYEHIVIASLSGGLWLCEEQLYHYSEISHYFNKTSKADT